MILQSHPGMMEATGGSLEAQAISPNEVMSVLERFHAELQECHDSQEVLELAGQSLRLLGIFEWLALLLNEPPDWDFEMRLCLPAERRGAMQRRVNDAIKAGTFAWALRQSRCVPVPALRADQEKPTLLHRLGTRARTIGMFAAAARPGVEAAQPAIFGPVGVILSSASYAIENLRLRGEVENHNLELQERVRQRTIELTQANELLSREVEEHGRSEEALAQEKDRLAVTLRSIGDGVITTDTAGNALLLNPVAETLTGWLQTEAAGRPLPTVFAPVRGEHREVQQGFLEAALKDGTETVVAQSCRLTSRDGRERAIVFKVSAIRRREGAAIIGAVLVIHDVTEHDRLAIEARKNLQLESLGVLAAGIAHDFNNLLTVIVGNVSLATEQAQARGLPVTGNLIEAAKAAQQARELTGQLLQFAKGGAPVKTAARLQETIRESAKFGLHGTPIQPEFLLPRDLWAVEADNSQISQVIHNLVINAVQAMPNGGRLRVAAANRTVGTSGTAGMAAGRYVRISVADEGCGVSPEALPRIFDPYFTTKKNGNGLGLAMCDVIIRNHGGRITVESEPGRGTAFHIDLPASDRVPVTVTPARRPAIGSRRGKILVLEDELALQTLMQAMFRRLGYQAEFVTRGEEALRVFRAAEAAAQPFDGAVLDLTVPGGMGGGEAIRHIHSIRPGFPALVSSGASTNPVVANWEAHGFCGTILKPYTLEQFAEAVERLVPERP